MLTDDMLCFLMDNANHRYTTDAEVRFAVFPTLPIRLGLTCAMCGV
jgi:hypothetical protein